MAWLYLVIAGFCEMFGVAMMNQYQKDRKWRSLFLLAAGFAISFLCLSVAMKSLPMGTAYAVWTGIGASGGALLGMLVYGESKDWRRLLCIVLVLGAAIGLKLYT